MQHSVSEELIAQAQRYLGECLERVGRCLDEITEEEVWKRPNANSNSIGNLVIHLQGNITQYVISSLGGAPDLRTRDAEFAATEGADKATLWAGIQQVVTEAQAVIGRMTPEQLLERRSVQGFDYTGVANVVHVVEHFSYHVGQMVFWVKLLKDKDLAFYGGIDLNAKNQ